MGFEPTTLCSLSYPLSYQGSSAGRGSNLQHNAIIMTRKLGEIFVSNKRVHDVTYSTYALHAHTYVCMYTR